MDEESDVKRIKLDLKLSLVPLFKTFCNHVELIKEAFDKELADTNGCSYPKENHPINIEGIKDTFKDSSYSSVIQFADDCKTITINLKEKNKNLYLDAAKDLELYIERTIIPVAYASCILKLYQPPNGSKIQLDLNNEIPEDQRAAFNSLSEIERLSMFLKWPLPILKDMDTTIRATASLSKNNKPKTKAKVEAKKKARGLKSSKEDVKSIRKRSKKFKLDNTSYKIGMTSSSQLPNFSFYITKSNNLDRSGFVAKYVDKFLASTDFSKIKLEEMPYSKGQIARYVGNERQVESVLRDSLYEVIMPLVKHSLDGYKEEVTDNLKDIIQKRQYSQVAAPTSKAEDASRDLLTSIFQADTHGSNFLGSNFKSDLEVGYVAQFESPHQRLPVLYTALGETKYLTFHLGQCINDLEGNQNGELSKFPKKRQSLITEVERTLYKYTSQCIRSGVPRFIITDLTGFLFVKLKFAREESREGYGTLSREDMQYVTAQYSYFSTDESYIRLYYASFCTIDEEYLEEMKEFRRQIDEELRAAEICARDKQLKKMSKESTHGAGTGASAEPNAAERRGCPTGKRGEKVGDINLSSNSRTDDGSTSAPLRPSDSSSIHYDIEEKEIASRIDNSSSNKSLIYDETMFKWVSYIELGDVITDIVEIGARAAQIVKIDSAKFSKLVFEKNMCVKEGDLPQDSILKVYDPSMGQLFEWDEDIDEPVLAKYHYQDCIDYTVNEVKAYCALSEFSGDFIPRLYSYGRLSDLYPHIDLLYLKLCGGYIMIEQLTEDDDFIITKKFFKRKILPAFRKMHTRNVIHNDIKWDNVMITKEGDFKIIDFGRSIISTSVLEKDAEIELVYEHFGSPEWR